MYGGKKKTQTKKNLPLIIHQCDMHLMQLVSVMESKILGRKPYTHTLSLIIFDWQPEEPNLSKYGFSHI